VYSVFKERERERKVRERWVLNVGSEMVNYGISLGNSRGFVCCWLLPLIYDGNFVFLLLGNVVAPTRFMTRFNNCCTQKAS
jgi:hypothetical protein